MNFFHVELNARGGQPREFAGSLLPNAASPLRRSVIEDIATPFLLLVHNHGHSLTQRASPRQAVNRPLPAKQVISLRCPSTKLTESDTTPSACGKRSRSCNSASCFLLSQTSSESKKASSSPVATRTPAFRAAPTPRRLGVRKRRMREPKRRVRTL